MTHSGSKQETPKSQQSRTAERPARGEDTQTGRVNGWGDHGPHHGLPVVYVMSHSVVSHVISCIVTVVFALGVHCAFILFPVLI